MNQLTLEAAKSLIGQTITTHYNGYAGQDGDDTFTVGRIASQYDIAKDKAYHGDNFANYAEYWDSYMSAAQLDKMHNRLEIVTANGRETSIRCDINSPEFDAPTFHCSDSDRVVTYKVI